MDKRFSQAEGKNFRYAIMCSGTSFQIWQRQAIESLLEVGAEPVLLIKDANKETNNYNQSKFTSFKKKFTRNFLWKIYRRYFDMPKAMQQVDMPESFKALPSVDCVVEYQGKYSQYFKQQDIDTLKFFNLDFILKFGFGITRGEILSVARYGIWSFHHDDEIYYRGGPPCFWEIYHGACYTGSMLQRITDVLDGGIILKKGFFSTINYSYAKNLDQAYFESANWPKQVCQDISAGIADYLDASPSNSKAPIYKDPGPVAVFIFMLKILRNRFLHFWKVWCHVEIWNIGKLSVPIAECLIGDDSFKNISYLTHHKKKSFAADPFGLVTKDRRFILYEKLNYSGRAPLKTGMICELNEQEDQQNTRPVMNLSCHASYPYLFEDNEQVYCVPETYELNQVCLYALEAKTNVWYKKGILIDKFSAVDPTVFHFDGYWWLICTNKASGANIALWIWYSEDGILGPWKSHPANPVKRDVRSTRPGGTPFIYEGQLYRPSQDCTGGTQWRLVINRVDVLTPKAFHETPVRIIDPIAPIFKDGLHTLSAFGNETLIDGKRLRFSIDPIVSRIRTRIKSSKARSIG